MERGEGIIKRKGFLRRVDFSRARSHLFRSIDHKKIYRYEESLQYYSYYSISRVRRGLKEQQNYERSTAQTIFKHLGMFPPAIAGNINMYVKYRSLCLSQSLSQTSAKEGRRVPYECVS